MEPNTSTPPTRIARRDTSSFLRPIANLFVESLGLQSPTPDAPGHWKTADGFLVVSTGLIKDGYQRPQDRLRALIAFHPRDTQQRTRARLRERFPQYDSLSQEQKRQMWPRVLHLGKQVRTERVQEIVLDLETRGVDLPVYSLVVHRVSHTFFATLTLEMLRKLLELRAGGYDEIKRIHIAQIATL